jgi:hypothetical protein
LDVATLILGGKDAEIPDLKQAICLAEETPSLRNMDERRRPSVSATGELQYLLYYTEEITVSLRLKKWTILFKGCMKSICLL